MAYASRVGTTPVDWAEFGVVVDSVRRRAGVAGLVAGIAVEGETVWSAAFGVAAPGRSCSLNTRFEIASLTKPIASIALLRLVEDGRVDVDEPIAGFVPLDSPFTGSLAEGPTVTVGHVWSHTSGLRLIPMGRKGRLFAPGTRFKYNGAAFGLLTDVVADRSSSSFGAVIDGILAEAGMADSSAGPAGSPDPEDTEYWRRPNRVSRALGRDRPRRPVPVRQRRWERALGLRPGPLNAAAGVVTTVPDLLQLDSRIDTGDVMTDFAKRLAWEPTALAEGPASPYGKGWFVTEWAGERAVWHYGHRPGVNSSLWVRVPRLRRSFVAFANSSGMSSGTGLGRGDLASSPFAEAIAAVMTGKMLR